MKTDMIFAYLIHLSANMWAEPGEDFARAPFYPANPTDEDVWKTTIDFLPSQGINTVLIDIGDCMEFETHPELNLPGAWSKDKLKNELDRIRSLGMTPLPKLNFSSRHDAWLGEYGKMLSTQKYYDVCRDVICEAAEVFDYPELFHLGMDEESAENQSRNKMFVDARQGEQWWKDNYFYFSVCDKIGARPWVWGDPSRNDPEKYKKRMPKSVVISETYYNYVEKNIDGTYADICCRNFCTLNESGFDQIPCCSTFYGDWECATDILTLGKKEISPEYLKGFMTASWFMTRRSDRYALLNDAVQFGQAKRTVYPELCK